MNMGKSKAHIETTSKFLSLVLRHKPEQIGLVLDNEGWASVPDLIRQASMQGIVLSRVLLSQLVAENDKQRFTYDSSRDRIRANQGHSIPVDLNLEPQEPPATLFHGTATRFLHPIGHQGLIPKDRQHVHLSADINTARTVGERHGKVVVLHIFALDAHKAGHKFYLSANGVWLADKVPPDFIDFENI